MPAELFMCNDRVLKMNMTARLSVMCAVFSSVMSAVFCDPWPECRMLGHWEAMLIEMRVYKYIMHVYVLVRVDSSLQLANLYSGLI